MSTDENSSVDLLKSRIEEQGNLVRQLKSDTKSQKVFLWIFSEDYQIFLSFFFLG